MFSQFGWFDDNSLGALRPFTSIAKKVRYVFWAEIRWEWEMEKAAVILFGDKIVTPIVGFDIHVAQRKTQLPPQKSQRYIDKVDEVTASAIAHPRELVRNEGLFDTLIGQMVHSSEVIPDLWQYFIELMAVLRDCRGPEYTRCPQAARRILWQMQECLRTNQGISLTPYSRRPGFDGLPVWLSFTDASRNTRTFFGAQGGFFWHWQHPVVFFFCRQWDPEEVQRSNIGELEFAAANTAAWLQSEVMSSLFQQDGSMHYLFQYGDNSAVFDYTLTRQISQ